MSERPAGDARGEVPAVQVMSLVPVFSSPDDPSRHIRMLLDHHTVGSTSFTLGVLTLEPGAATPQSQHSEEEGYLVLSGEAQLELRERRFGLRPGHAVFIPPGMPHRFINASADATHLVWVMSPPASLQSWRAWGTDRSSVVMGSAGVVSTTLFEEKTT